MQENALNDTLFRKLLSTTVFNWSCGKDIKIMEKFIGNHGILTAQNTFNFVHENLVKNLCLLPNKLQDYCFFLNFALLSYKSMVILSC